MHSANKTTKYSVAKYTDLVITNEDPTKPTIELTQEDFDILDRLKTVSNRIRYLDNKGVPRNLIAKLLGKKYQHVRNVLETPLKKRKYQLHVNAPVAHK